MKLSFYDWCIQNNRKERGISPEESFNLLKYRDSIKKECAIKNGYYFLEIPYWTESDNSYQPLIDSKISEILLTIQN